MRGSSASSGFTAASVRDELSPTSSLETFSTVLGYCVLILVMPILSFFVSKSFVLERVLGMSDPDSAIWVNVVSAIVAVLVLHGALGIFIYKAYFEGAPAKAKIGKQE